MWPMNIERGLAISLAGQVSAGLAAGEGQEERAVRSLIAIALMLLNATDEPIVHETMALIEDMSVERTEHGGWQFTFRPPSE
jgi:hypothetical protein